MVAPSEPIRPSLFVIKLQSAVEEKVTIKSKVFPFFILHQNQRCRKKYESLYRLLNRYTIDAHEEGNTPAITCIRNISNKSLPCVL